MRRSALTLAALLAASRAAADPVVVRHERPRFTLTVPDRFERVEPDGAHGDLLDVFRRPGDLPDEPPMVLQVLHLDAVLPQRALLPAERAEFRRADAFRFTDHVEHDRVLGFPVETLVGEATLPSGVGVTRFATAIPLEDDAVLLVLLAPGHRARDARALLRATLDSTRAPTTWETPARRAVNQAMRVALLLTLLSSMAYGLAAAITARRASLPPRTRMRATALLAALWWSVSLWLCVPWRDDEWLFALLALGLAGTFSALALRAASIKGSSSAPDRGR